MWLGADAPESAVRFYPLAVISHGAIGASVLVSKLPDTLSLDYLGRRTRQLSRKIKFFGYSTHFLPSSS
jgi:hypothetical protein